MTTTGMTGCPVPVPYDPPAGAWEDQRVVQETLLVPVAVAPDHYSAISVEMLVADIERWLPLPWEATARTKLHHLATRLNDAREALEAISAFCDDHPGDARLSSIWDMATASRIEVNR